MKFSIFVVPTKQLTILPHYPRTKMPVTFGSVGDIISVSLLIKDLLVALDDTRGASGEYRAIIRELYTLDSALLHVEQLSRTNIATPELHALCQTAQSTVTRCRTSITEFKQRLQKYKDTMRVGGSGCTVRDIGKKLQWSIGEKDYIARFRAEITGYTESISMLTTIASMYESTFQTERVETDSLTVSSLTSTTSNLLRILQPMSNGEMLYRMSRSRIFNRDSTKIRRKLL